MNKQLGNIAGIISFVVAYALFRYVGLVGLLFLGAFLIGVWFPGWYFKKTSSNKAVIKWLSWSNLLTWFLPPLGILISVATYKSMPYSDSQSQNRVRNLAIIGFVLSIGNAAVGVIQALQ